jgi:hypothetical protein
MSLTSSPLSSFLFKPLKCHLNTVAAAMHNNDVPQFIAIAPAYRGAAFFWYAYAVPILAALLKALMAAMAAARFAGGRGRVFEIQVNETT